jgi:deazaflavin-dependent oxidoreductase (nitroreductase family)
MTAAFRAATSLHALIYRATSGRWGTRIRGLPILLLTTSGRRTGRPRTTPLGYFEDRGRYVITASNSGLDRHPGWFHNLKANPAVRVQVGGRRLGAQAEVAEGSERRRLWERLMALSPSYAAYARRTSREIPMVVLSPQAS